MTRLKGIAVLLLALTVLVGCAKSTKPPVKDNVEQSLKQAGMGDVNVDEDRDKGVITLKGDVKSDDEKQRAGQTAQQAAPGAVVANELGVRPEGMESTAKSTSVVSITSSTTNSGVAYSPGRRTKNLPPS